MEKKADKEHLIPLLGAIRALQSSMEAINCRGYFIGGVAASMLGRPRLTRDVDAVILIDDTEVEYFLNSTKKQGINPRIDDILSFSQRSNVLLLVHNATNINIDVSIGLLPFEYETFHRSKFLKFSGVSLRVPTPEDLIIMKTVAGRPRDFEDIRGIIVAHPDLDKTRIENWVRQFANTLDSPEMWKDLEKILYS